MTTGFSIIVHLFDQRHSDVTLRQAYGSLRCSPSKESVAQWVLLVRRLSRDSTDQPMIMVPKLLRGDRAIESNWSEYVALLPDRTRHSVMQSIAAQNDQDELLLHVGN